MVLKVASFIIILTEIISVYGQQTRFVIENKKTGKVIEDVAEGHKMMEWDNTDHQLWTLKPSGNGSHITNVATGFYIYCPILGKNYASWKMNTQKDTWIEVEEPSIFLWGDDVLRCSTSKKNDLTDEWKFIEQSKKLNMKFSIENKKTGDVVEEKDATLQVGPWRNRDWQLWTLKPQNKSGYSIVNVANGKILTYSKNDMDQEIWKLISHGDTRIQNEDGDVFLTLKDSRPVFVGYNNQNDASDRWVFVQRESEKNNKKLTRVYVDGYQEKFVIENEKTGLVIEAIKGGHQVMEWDNIDSQLWTFEPHNKSGYKIRNVATKKNIVCTIDDQDYYVWKFGTSHTRIEIERPAIILYYTIDDNIIRCSTSKRNDSTEIWRIIEQYKKINMKFVIENKATGDILEDADATLNMEKWENRDLQLWTLIPKNESGFSIINVATRKILSYSKNGTNYDILKLNTRGDTWIKIEEPNVYLTNKNGKPVFLGQKQNDYSQKWLLVERDSEKIDITPKRIYVQDYQEKFVIENKKTGMVLGAPHQYLGIEEWEDEDSQLWILERQKESEYFIIRNAANRRMFTYDKNGTDCHLWKLDVHGETLIKGKDINAFFADRGGELIFVPNKQNDGSDVWLLVDQISKRSSTKPKPIYIEPQLSIDIV